MFEAKRVMLLGHQKAPQHQGKPHAQLRLRARPRGTAKALRIMAGHKFDLPGHLLRHNPGAYSFWHRSRGTRPGAAPSRSNLKGCFTSRFPIIVVVIARAVSWRRARIDVGDRAF
jgi:acetyl-CoA carboxylase alpha subunit